LDIRRFSQTEPFVNAVSDAVAGALADVLAARPLAVLAVPGGRTARALLPRIAALPLSWDRVTITLTDERWVPVDHPDSNEGLVRSLLKGPAAARLQGLFRDGTTPEEALPELIARMPTADLVLLGMGEDGHIASIFPNEAANRATAALAVVDRPDHRRVTMTPRALGAARRVVVAVTGVAKQAVVEQALLGDRLDELPVRHALAAGAAVFIGPEH
jgi:6-phosphogluconolactonase